MTKAHDVAQERAREVTRQLAAKAAAEAARVERERVAQKAADIAKGGKR